MSVFIGSKLEAQPLQRCFLPLPEVVVLGGGGGGGGSSSSGRWRLIIIVGVVVICLLKSSKYVGVISHLHILQRPSHLVLFYDL